MLADVYMLCDQILKNKICAEIPIPSPTRLLLFVCLFVCMSLFNIIKITIIHVISEKPKLENAKK